MRLTEEPKVKVSVRMPAIYMKILRDMAYNNAKMKSVNKIVTDAIANYIRDGTDIADNTVYAEYEIATFLIPVSLYTTLMTFVQDRKVTVSEVVRNAIYLYISKVMHNDS
ncbi:ribbon-helix-helix domain [Sulfolobales Beppu filamentous virus 3]|uniref:Ribbon-helix-helix domain n=1 Tax=Sulfolobales Beppu filamentous virus 3 TaxID=2493124 RepID=A0A3S8NF24_9VIRU|nr:ribbon-helix-helix domain [Sulfolobales Beppu filamentous virus 3]AZI75848.1 ribbon-helix-helix domain [Sulfolobales Beppu filamentous virus 3]